jgi:hypothetical protein
VVDEAVVNGQAEPYLIYDGGAVQAKTASEKLSG